MTLRLTNGLPYTVFVPTCGVLSPGEEAMFYYGAKAPPIIFRMDPHGELEQVTTPIHFPGHERTSVLLNETYLKQYEEKLKKGREEEKFSQAWARWQMEHDVVE